MKKVNEITISNRCFQSLKLKESRINSIQGTKLFLQESKHLIDIHQIRFCMIVLLLNHLKLLLYIKNDLKQVIIKAIIEESWWTLSLTWNKLKLRALTWSYWLIQTPKQSGIILSNQICLPNVIWWVIHKQLVSFLTLQHQKCIWVNIHFS